MSEKKLEFPVIFMKRSIDSSCILVDNNFHATSSPNLNYFTVNIPAVLKIDNSIISYMENKQNFELQIHSHRFTKMSNDKVDIFFLVDFSPISLQLESSRYSFVHMIPAIEIISRLPCPCSPGY